MKTPSAIQGQRAESIAFLVLTESRMGVVSKESRDAGFDFTVQLLDGSRLTNWSIAIELKGTTEDPQRFYKTSQQSVHLRLVEDAITPVIFLIVNVKTEAAWGAWLKRPGPTGKLAMMAGTGRDVELQRMDRKVVEAFYREALQYYRELSKRLNAASASPWSAGADFPEIEFRFQIEHVVRLVASTVGVAESEWLSFPELLDAIDLADAKARALLGAHMSAFRHWLDFHRLVALEKPQGTLNTQETAKLAKLVKAKDHSRKELADYVSERYG
jgi:hypothetical protein